MKPKMRCNLSGAFAARELDRGAWRLARGAPAPVEILLDGAQSSDAAVFQAPGLSDIELEWQDSTVLLTLTSAQRRICVKARSAIVHEPLQHLYDVLPLAEFDPEARRFWRWVFRLVRIPGGRYLLDVLARRTRGRV